MGAALGFHALAADKKVTASAPVSVEAPTASLDAFVQQLNRILGLLGARQSTNEKSITFVGYGAPGFEIGRIIIALPTTQGQLGRTIDYVALIQRMHRRDGDR